MLVDSSDNHSRVLILTNSLSHVLFLLLGEEGVSVNCRQCRFTCKRIVILVCLVCKKHRRDDGNHSLNLVEDKLVLETGSSNECFVGPTRVILFFQKPVLLPDCCETTLSTPFSKVFYVSLFWFALTGGQRWSQ